MSKLHEEYLQFLAENSDWAATKEQMPFVTIKIAGPNNKVIELKEPIGLNYFCTDELDIVYVEDVSENKQFTHDLSNKTFKLHLTEQVIYIDFNTDYYYLLTDFDTLPQMKHCQTHKKLTIALLNEDKSDIINKWTTDVNLL